MEVEDIHFCCNLTDLFLVFFTSLALVLPTIRSRLPNHVRQRQARVRRGMNKARGKSKIRNPKLKENLKSQFPKRIIAEAGFFGDTHSWVTAWY